MTDSARTALATLRDGFLNFGENRFPLLARAIVERPFAGEVVNLAKDIRESTAREIADWLDYANEAMLLPADKYKCVKKLTEAIRGKYGVTP